MVAGVVRHEGGLIDLGGRAKTLCSSREQQ
jgi:hypothetical protein